MKHLARIALFGGTFDPPHRAHLFIARESVRELNLDRVIFIPCHQSPHKKKAPGASDEQRLEMLRLATSRLAWAEVSSWEVDREGASYSWQTVEHFSSLHPKSHLYWIMGADQWQVLEKWSNPNLLAKLLTFIVFPRDGVTPAMRPPFRAHFLTAAMRVSATEIRRRAKAREDYSDLVPNAVRAYVEKHQLYQL